MRLLAIMMLSTLASAQLVGVDVNVPDGRDAADALGFHGVEMVRSLPSPLISTDLREALHVEPGAIVLNVTVPREALHVAPGAVTITIEIPIDRAAEIVIPWLDEIVLPALREEAQMARDDLRTSFGRDSAEIVAEIRWWRTPGIALLAALILLALCACYERLTNNRKESRRG